jgi:hypothetical protein
MLRIAGSVVRVAVVGLVLWWWVGPLLAS